MPISDNISGFKGIYPEPIATITWQKVLNNIKSGKYEKPINTVRDIISKYGAKSEKYKKAKCHLPSVSFGGTFSHRANNQIISPTGFIIPDMDNIPKQVESLFNLLLQDTNIWFVFRSPSGQGLKVGIRANDITNDDDHKKLYFSVERYFKELYGVKIDVACKDISRLTFVSHDPNLWIHSEPQFFDIEVWQPEKSVAETPIYIPQEWNSNKEKYASKVLEGCCQKLLECPEGTKHITRLKQARLIGGYIQWLNEDKVLSLFEQSIIASGTPNVAQAMKTVRDGIEYGKAKPLVIEDLNTFQKNNDITYYYEEHEISNSDDNLDDYEDIRGHFDNFEDIRGHSEDSMRTLRGQHEDTYEDKIENEMIPQEKNKKYYEGNKRNISEVNLSAAIQDWIMSSAGSFTIEQLDNELGLRTRLEKKNRSQILQRLVGTNFATRARARVYNNNNININNNKEIILKKDSNKNNIYHIISTSMDWIDLSFPTESNFPIILPFELDKKISIPPKSIIVIAGTTNSAKTALILNILRLNLKSNFEKLFLVSEGAGEIKGRIKSFGDPIDLWKDNVMIASQSDNFDIAIENYNRDGLTCIDYLEPPEGQYYLLTNQIRTIYDCLDSGVALIALQKRSNQIMGRGGEGTAEKARLYITVDFLCSCQKSVVCAISLTKVKQSLDDNMQGKELHFRLERGSKITPLTDWMFSNRVNREKCIREYENEDAQKTYKKIEEGDYIFRTANGNGQIKMVRITRKQAEEWARAMPHINVFKKLEQMAKDSMKRLFLDKSYFYQIPSILAKAEDEATMFQMGESG